MPRLAPRWPTSDWTCREVQDAQAIDPTIGHSRCAFCGTRIRWIHVLEHEDYRDTVEAGCCCAVRLCLDYDAEGAEREVKNRMARQARFVDARRWTRSRHNPENIWRTVRMPDNSKRRVTVFLRYSLYAICVAGRNERSFHPEKYGTQAEALVVAFGLVEGAKESVNGGAL